MKTAVRDTFRSLSVRNFRLYYGGQGVSQIGNWLTLIAQTLWVLHLTGSGVAVGLLTAAQFLPVLLVGAWAGLVVDRMDKRRLLIGVQVVAMAQSFVLAALAFSSWHPLPAIFGVAAVGGLTTAFDNPARRTFVVELVPEADVHNAVALNNALMTSARVVGPALAGVLVSITGFGWCFLLDGLSYVAVLVALARIDMMSVRTAPVVERAKGQVRAGLRYVRGVPALWVTLVVMAVIGTLTYNFSVVFPLFVTRTLRGDTWDFAVLYSLTSVGSLFGSLSTARRERMELRTVIVTAAMFGMAMTIMSAAPNLVAAYALGAVVGFSASSFMTAATSIMQLQADPVMRGRVLSLQAMVFLGTTPIGGPILGTVCDALGARAGLVVGGVAALAAAAIGVVLRRRADDAACVGTVQVIGASA